MRQLSLLALMILFITACQPKDLPTVINVSQEQVLLKASHMTTKADLINFEAQIQKQHGLAADFSACSYFDSGTLQHFDAVLLKGEQKLASVSADLASLQFKYYGFTMTLEGDLVSHMRAGSF